MKRTLFFLLTFAIAAGLLAGDSDAARFSLGQLEPSVNRSPNVLTAVAQIESQKSLLAKEEAVSGVEIFGSAGLGRYKDLVDENRIWYHTGGRFLAGLSYPLLGSAERKRRLVLDAEDSVKEKKIMAEEVRRKSLAALRMSYVNYWAAKEKERIARIYLPVCQASVRTLERRGAKGFALSSEALDAADDCQKVRSYIASLGAQRRKSLRELRLLTDRDLPDFRPYRPELPMPSMTEREYLARVAERSPRIEAARLRFRNAVEKVDGSAFAAIESDLRLVGHVDPEYDSARQGHGVVLSWNVKMPLRFLEANRAMSEMDRLEIEKSAIALKKEGERVLSEARYALDTMETAKEDFRSAETALHAALEHLREALLRQEAGRVGPTEVHRAKFLYFKRALDYVQAYASMQNALAAVLYRLSDEGGKRAAQPFFYEEGLTAPLKEGPKKPAAASATPGLYLWRSGDWIETDDSWHSLLQRLREWGVGRILLGLDGRQIRSLRDPETFHAWAKRLREAQKEGIEVEALLGEPTWLLPEGREKLLQIVQAIEPLPFRAIHLDLEPEQLTMPPSPKEGARRIYETLRAVASVTKRPLGLSLHPRELDREATGFDLAELLHRDRIEIAVMLYGYGVEALDEWMERFRADHPGITPTVAISVEPEIEGNPFALASQTALFEKIGALRKKKAMIEVPLLIQDFSHIERMRP